MKKTKKWVVTVEPDENPDFCIIPLPQEVLTHMGWEVGDEIKAEVITDAIVLSKPG